MSGRSLPFFLRALEHSGVSLEELARAADLSVAELSVSHAIEYDTGMRLWRAAESVSGDPYVGLHLGAGIRLDQVGPLGPVMGHARDLRCGLEALAAVFSLVVDGSTLSLEGRSLRYRSPRVDGPALRHGVDAILAAIVAMARECTGRPLSLEAVAFEVEPPPRAGPYERFFGVRPRWRQPVSSLVFDERSLALPMRSADPRFSQLVVENAGALLSGPAAPPWVRDVEGALAGCLRDGLHPTIESVAERLGTSRRSLQRRLRRADTSFREVRARALREIATRWLREGSLGVDEIAERLGYASRAAFERAFRRWTGETPAAVRKRQ
ncbi:MAG: AraC family transcriptional regulator [Sandaracinaceae bacterium]